MTTMALGSIPTAERCHYRHDIGIDSLNETGRYGCHSRSALAASGYLLDQYRDMFRRHQQSVLHRLQDIDPAPGSLKPCYQSRRPFPPLDEGDSLMLS